MWGRPPVWHHGDLDARNWLVRDHRIGGVIDWGLMGVGDPACDLMVAWKLHSPAARDAFRDALPADDATWERARGWVVLETIAEWEPRDFDRYEALEKADIERAPDLYAGTTDDLRVVDRWGSDRHGLEEC